MSETTSFNPSSEYINALQSKLAHENLSQGDINSLDSDFSEVEKQYLEKSPSKYIIATIQEEEE